MLSTTSTLTIDQLRLSPFNVRMHQPDAEAVEALAAMILHQGQLKPVLCHRLRGSATLYGVHAGGRRYRAFKLLIGRGDLPADHPVLAIEREGFTDAQLMKDSFIENFGRVDFREYEVDGIIGRLVRAGVTPEEIATEMGQDPAWVERRLRMSHLAPVIFRAWAAGIITDDQAHAFGATGDHAAQLAAWAELQRQAEPRKHAVERIRAAMKFDDADGRRRLRYVGEDAYLAAGGRLEPDLFDPSGVRVRIVDEVKLGELAHLRLDALRAETRLRVNRPDLRFVEFPPRNEWGGADYQLQVPQSAADKGQLPAGDVVARIELSDEGVAAVDFWWASRKAKHAGTTRPRAAAKVGVNVPGLALADPAAAKRADEEIREATGLQSVGVQILRGVRRAILRAMLVTNARAGRDVATDFLVFTQARAIVRGDDANRLGVGRLADPPELQAAHGHVGQTRGQKHFAEALHELNEWTFMREPDHRAAFRAYLAAPPQVKRLAAAAVAGMSLHPSLCDDLYGFPLHDELAAQLRGGPGADRDVRHWWTPTAEWLAHYPARDRLALAEPFVDRVTIGAWQRLRDAHLTHQVLWVLTGVSKHVKTATHKLAAAQWTPDLLRFAPAADPDEGGPEPAAADRETEAA